MLQGEQVYSVKWYKGGLEIFRHLPSATEQQTTCFPRPGVTIDEVSASIQMMAADNRPDTNQTSPSSSRCQQRRITACIIIIIVLPRTAATLHKHTHSNPSGDIEQFIYST